MIFFISDGRLGNQAFQYAFLNSIAKSNEKIICVNMTQFFEHFDFKNENFSFLPESRLLSFFFRKMLSRVLTLLVKLKMISSAEQQTISGKPLPKVSFSKGVLPFTFVKLGFFQSELLLRKDKIDFVIKNKYYSVALKILNSLPQSNKVFVHIRRGDYLDETYNGQKGLALPKQYYLEAMTEIERSVANPFYVFLTDDPGYVEDVYGYISNKYISRESLGVDFAIMGLCDYGIVSNSSFSWWGSFFSKEKKLIIFPMYWYGWKTKCESHPTIQPSWAHLIEPRRPSDNY